jgi:hypothetical protein
VDDPTQEDDLGERCGMNGEERSRTGGAEGIGAEKKDDIKNYLK